MTGKDTSPPRVYRYYDLVMAAFVTTLLCANIIGVGKPCAVGPTTVGGYALRAAPR